MLSLWKDHTLCKKLSSLPTTAQTAADPTRVTKEVQNMTILFTSSLAVSFPLFPSQPSWAWETQGSCRGSLHCWVERTPLSISKPVFHPAGEIKKKKQKTTTLHSSLYENKLKIQGGLSWLNIGIWREPLGHLTGCSLGSTANPFYSSTFSAKLLPLGLCSSGPTEKFVNPSLPDAMNSRGCIAIFVTTYSQQIPEYLREKQLPFFVSWRFTCFARILQLTSFSFLHIATFL